MLSVVITVSSHSNILEQKKGLDVHHLLSDKESGYSSSEDNSLLYFNYGDDLKEINQGLSPKKASKGTKKGIKDDKSFFETNKDFPSESSSDSSSDTSGFDDEDVGVNDKYNLIKKAKNDKEFKMKIKENKEKRNMERKRQKSRISNGSSLRKSRCKGDF